MSCVRPSSRGRSTRIVDLFPAAGWDEREAHDLPWRAFQRARADARPWWSTRSDPAAWTVPVRGHDSYQVAVGPIHAGVIESGHFRFHRRGGAHPAPRPAPVLQAPRPASAPPRHRPLADGLRYAQRACAACAVTNTVAYAQACEAALGLAPDREPAPGAHAATRAGAPLQPPATTSPRSAPASASPPARWHSRRSRSAHNDSTQRLTGHRFLFDTVALGASTLRIAARRTRALPARSCATLAREAADVWRELQFAASVQDRLGDVGRARPSRTRSVSAPSARRRVRPACARTHVAKAHDSLYSDFTPAAPSRTTGDVAARLDIRADRARADLCDP